MLPFFDSPPRTQFRRPACQLAFDGGFEGDSLTAVRVARGLGDAVDYVELSLGPSPPAGLLSFGSAEPELGETCTVSLGYADGEMETVFTGWIDRISKGLDGGTRIGLANGGARLARLRVEASYYGETAGGIVTALAGEGGIDTGTVEDGLSLPAYVIDGGRSAWSHCAELATRHGFLLYLDSEDVLHFREPPEEPAEIVFSYGVDLISARASSASPHPVGIRATGEGAAGSQGTNAWNWLVKDPGGVRAEMGEAPFVPVADGALRSGESSETVATNRLNRATAGADRLRATVPGTAALGPGVLVEILEAPSESLNGVFLIHAVQHRFDVRRGFVSVIDGVRAGASDSLLGGLF